MLHFRDSYQRFSRASSNLGDDEVGVRESDGPVEVELQEADRRDQEREIHYHGEDRPLLFQKRCRYRTDRKCRQTAIDEAQDPVARIFSQGKTGSAFGYLLY